MIRALSASRYAGGCERHSFACASLLDEPFGALDAKVRKDLRRWLRHLHERLGLTTIFVTHDQEEALDLADEVAVTNAGGIEQMDVPETFSQTRRRDGGLCAAPEFAFARGGEPAIPVTVTNVLAAGSAVRIDCVRQGGEVLEVAGARR